MEKIIIKQTNDGFTVEQGNKIADELAWEEMLGVVTSLTIPEKNICLQWMKENEKPYIPKDGDFVVSGWKEEDGEECKWVAIVRGKYDRNFYLTYYGRYITKESDDRDCWFNESADGHTYTREATEEEIQFALDGLHEDGYDWDAEKKEIVDWVWQPKEGEDVFIPSFKSAHFSPIRSTWRSNDVECMNLKIQGYVKRTHEECQELCDQLNKRIK